MNGIVAYLQDADGNERTLDVTKPDPEDGTYCVYMDDKGQAWIRIVPMDLSIVVDMIQQLEDQKPEPNWDDMHEWDVDEISTRYMWTEEQATMFWYYLQEQMNPQFNMYGLNKEWAPYVLENIQESLHQSLDGWTEEQKLVIRAYLADLALATHVHDKVLNKED